MCASACAHRLYIYIDIYIKKKKKTWNRSDTPSLGPDLPRRHSADASGELQDLANMSLGVFSVRSAIDTISSPRAKPMRNLLELKRLKLKMCRTLAAGIQALIKGTWHRHSQWVSRRISWRGWIEALGSPATLPATLPRSPFAARNFKRSRSWNHTDFMSRKSSIPRYDEMNQRCGLAEQLYINGTGRSFAQVCGRPARGWGWLVHILPCTPCTWHFRRPLSRIPASLWSPASAIGTERSQGGGTVMAFPDCMKKPANCGWF